MNIMKIWIVRSEASSIMYGGLERLFIWFRKPRYMVEIITDKYRDTPFGDLHESQYPYYKHHGWVSNETMWTGAESTLSFGKIFGYCDEDSPNKEIAEYVWLKLNEHFKMQPFATWEDMERQGLVKIEDFLLELDLTIGLHYT